MLGFGPLGARALGEIPAINGVALGAFLDLDVTIEAGAASGEIAAGNAVAPGGLLPLTLILDAGTASGERQLTFGGIYRPIRLNAIARGALIEISISLLPGRVTVSAAARGAVLPLIRAGVFEAGTAAGFDMIASDNDFLLLDEAA